MATEVLKNQLIEFPQYQAPQENDPNPQRPSTTQPKIDHRSSIDLSQEDAIRVAAESARALESFKIMSEINTGTNLCASKFYEMIEPDVDDSARPSVAFTSVVSEVEKKLNASEENSGQWASIAPHSSDNMHHVESHHKIKQPIHSSENGASNHLIQQQHQRTKILQKQQLKESKPCVYSITVDYGSEETDSESSPLPEPVASYSWMGTVGSLFWSPAEDLTMNSNAIVKTGPYEGSPSGLDNFIFRTS